MNNSITKDDLVNRLGDRDNLVCTAVNSAKVAEEALETIRSFGNSYAVSRLDVPGLGFIEARSKLIKHLINFIRDFGVGDFIRIIRTDEKAATAVGTMYAEIIVLDKEKLRLALALEADKYFTSSFFHYAPTLYYADK